MTNRARQIQEQLYLKQHPVSSVKAVGGGSIDMMDKSRESENNITPGFKDRKLHRIKRTAAASEFSLSVQPNAELCQAELKENRKP